MYILWAAQRNVVVARGAGEQVSVSSSLFKSHRANGVALLKHLIVRGVFLDEPGHPRVLGSIGDFVEREAKGKSRHGDVETWLL